jgi:serine/threonine protein kinase
MHTPMASESRKWKQLRAIRDFVCGLVCRLHREHSGIPMTTVPLSDERPEAPLFTDGLGDRVVAADGATGELLQILRIRPALTAVPSFEFALRERAARLANFRHAYYARVRRIDRVQVPSAGLSIVSDHVEGTRLSDILRVAHERRLQLDINAALCLIRQLVPAVALLHENAREVAHGLIAPERLVVTPHARLVIVEHVMAAAVEQLQFGRDRLWQEFRISMPPSAGLPRFDHRADVMGMGLVALALVLGRPIEAHEFPNQLSALLNDARERTALGEEQPLSQPLRDWLGRALQLDTRRAFASAPEALASLEELVADDSMYVAAPIALETFLSRYIASLLELPAEAMDAPEPVVILPPAPVQTHSTHTHAAPTYSAKPAPPPVTPAVPLVTPAAPATITPSTPIVSAPVVSAPAPPVTASPTPKPSVPVDSGLSTKVGAARDITELIQAADLKVKQDPLPPAHEPLFNPDAPFSVPVPASSEPKAKAKKEKAKSAGPKIKISRRSVIVAAAVVIIATAAVVAPKFLTNMGAAQPKMGTLFVQSNPAGIPVFVDGEARGQTPARLSVKAGPHILELRRGGVPRTIPLTVAEGAEVSQYLEYPNTPETGGLRVESQPAGAKVLVDGTDRGVAPLTIEQILPGDHEVVLQTPAGSTRHVVSVQAGATASLVAPVASAAAASGPVSGWLTVKAPFSLEIREDGQLLGTTDSDRLMLASGRHDLQLVSETMSYRVNRSVQVTPGKVSFLTIEPPNGVVNLNAVPWAEVFVDGQRVGETPIGNLQVPIGQHEVIFRHPQFGEKRHAISVTLGQPTRLSVQMK